MKTIYEHGFGGDGAKAGLYVDGADLALKVAYPIAKIMEPAAKAADSLVDKIEQWIPGDQKALAEKLKAEYREELLKLLSEQA